MLIVGLFQIIRRKKTLILNIIKLFSKLQILTRIELEKCKRPFHFLAFVRISRRKRLEINLRRSHARLTPQCGDNLKIFASQNTDESIGTFHLCPRFNLSGGFRLRKDEEEEMSVAFLERETFFVSVHLLNFLHLLLCSILYLLFLAISSPLSLSLSLPLFFSFLFPFL